MFSVLAETFSFVFSKVDLPQSDRLRRYLNILVRLDVFKRFFKRKLYRRGYTHFFISTGSTHVRKFLGLSHVNDKVTASAVLADNLAFVNRFAGVASINSAKMFLF